MSINLLSAVPSVADVSQYLFSGLTIGCTTALVALGFVLIANVTGVFNFAQGDYAMLGGMVTAWAAREGLGFGAAVPLAVLAVAGFALIQERATVAPVRGKVGPLGLVVVALGVGVLLRGLALLAWGTDPLPARSFTLVSWDSGVVVGLTAFIAAAIGGFASPTRAVLAGLGLGVVETLAAGLVSSSYRQAFVFGALLLYLLLRDVAGESGAARRSLRRHPGRRARPPTPPPAVARARPSARGLATAAWKPCALVGVAALFPAVVSGPQARDAAVLVVLAAIGAVGLSLVMGLAGQLSLGQAAFYLVGGYSAAILTARYQVQPLLALLLAVVVSALVAYTVGWLTLGLRGFNLAIATLAVQLLLLIVVTQQTGLTGGQLGLIGVPPFRLFGISMYDPLRFFYVAAAVLALCLLVARNLSRSRIGLALRALGADAEGAEAIGLRTARLKLTVFVVAGAMGGLAGALWAYYIRFADPSTWGVQLTIDLITYVIVGGLTSVYGGAVGAIVVGSLQYWLRASGLSGPSSQEVEVILSGLLLICFVLVFRNGLVEALNLERLWRRTARATAPPPKLSTRGTAAAPRVSALATLPSRNGSHPVEPEAGLVVSGLSKRFGGFAALSELDFALRPGFVTAMVGPNGAGKSTAINLVAGVLAPSGGRVLLGGRRIDGLRADAVARLGIARTFQTPKLFGGLTVLETVMLARDRYARGTLIDAAVRSPRARREERAAREEALRWLDAVDLRASAGLAAGALPVGHQRLLDVARALAAEPTVLLLDEPAAGLDPAETEWLGKLVRAIAATRVAVLLVEHDMSLVMSIADRVIVLEQGRKIADGPPAAVASDEAVVRAYLGAVYA